MSSRNTDTLCSVETKIKWRIARFKDRSDSSFIDSPYEIQIFQQNSMFNVTLKIVYHPNDNLQKNMFIYLEVDEDSSTDKSLDQRLKIYIFNRKHEIVIERIFKPLLYNECTQRFCTSHYVNKDLILNKENEILDDDGSLTMVFEATDTDLNTKEIEKPCVLNLHKEFNDFENIFNSKRFSDVTFFVNGKAIYAHKNILSTRSAVFQAMFQHDMEEKNLSLVKITDIKYEVLMEVFRFIYTAKVEGIETMAIDLLMAADKYALEGLKVLSGNALYANLTFENAFEYLYLASTHNATDLRSQVIQYIISNSNSLIDKPGLDLLKKLSPDDSLEFIRKVLEQKNSASFI